MSSELPEIKTRSSQIMSLEKIECLKFRFSYLLYCTFLTLYYKWERLGVGNFITFYNIGEGWFKIDSFLLCLKSTAP